MATLIKGLILILFAAVVFARNYFPSNLIYWLTYVAIFALVPLWWFAAYWISDKKAKEILSEDVEDTFFVGMVADNPNNDLIRGRLVITPKDVKLLSKDKSGISVIWSEKRKNITSVGIGKVVGSRNGLKIFTDKSEVSFATGKAEDIQKALVK